MGGDDPSTVLVVEDEPPLVEVYVRWLEGSYDVLTAGSGSEALEVIDESVDIVLLDRLMPGMSGGDVLEDISRRFPKCKVAMVTAVEPDFDVVTMGFDAYLTKPVEREDLQRTVERLLARNSFADLEREFYSLAARRAALQETKSEAELRESEEYAELEAQVRGVREELDRTLPGMGDGEFVAMVREIDDDRDGDDEHEGGNGHAGGRGNGAGNGEDPDGL